MHDGATRRIDLHFYEPLDDGATLHYGSVAAPFRFDRDDLAGHGVIDGVDVRCESAEFALRCHTGYEPRDIDRHDVAALCERFGIALPSGYR